MPAAIVPLERDLFAPLRDRCSPRKKLLSMLRTLDAFYQGGQSACLLERLAASTERARFRRPLERAFSTWIDAIEALCLEGGVSRVEARRRAEDAVVRIEGSLVVSAGTHDPGPFQRTLADLRRSLLA